MTRDADPASRWGPWHSRQTGYRFRVFTWLGLRDILRRIRRAETWAGKARHVWHIFYDSELCERCGRRYDGFLWWCESNALYDQITGRGAGGCFCPRCFDEKARALGILFTWTPRFHDEYRVEPEFDSRARSAS